MCTCCITWWPRHPVFCWIEHSRHSRAVVGYVTSWAHACLSVSCGVSRGTAGAPSKLRSTLATLLLPRGCDPTTTTATPVSSTLLLLLPLPLVSQPCPLSPSLSRRKTLLVTLWPRCTVLLLPVCPSWSHSSTAPLLLRALPMCKWFVQVFSATLHRPPSSCCLSLHNVWLYLSCWVYRRLWELAGRSLNARAQFNHRLSFVSSQCCFH